MGSLPLGTSHRSHVLFIFQRATTDLCEAMRRLRGRGIRWGMVGWKMQEISSRKPIILKPFSHGNIEVSHFMQLIMPRPRGLTVFTCIYSIPKWFEQWALQKSRLLVAWNVRLDATYLSNTVTVAQMCLSVAEKIGANRSYTTLWLLTKVLSCADSSVDSGWPVCEHSRRSFPGSLMGIDGWSDNPCGKLTVCYGSHFPFIDDLPFSVVMLNSRRVLL